MNVWWLLAGLTLWRLGGDPTKRRHQGVRGQLCMGVSAGAPQRPWQGFRTGVICQELPQKGSIYPGGKMQTWV